jgi:hypothetical protein
MKSLESKSGVFEEQDPDEDQSVRGSVDGHSWLL